MNWETSNRARGLRPTIPAYLRARAITVGMYTEYALFDVTHQVYTNDRFWVDPDLRRLMTMTANVIGWSNDVFSYHKEREAGDPHNLVLLLGLEHSLDDEESCGLAIDMHNHEMQRFVELAGAVATKRSRDEPAVREFVDMLRAWIRANLDWAHASSRYGLHDSAPTRTVTERIEPIQPGFPTWSPRLPTGSGPSPRAYAA